MLSDELPAFAMLPTAMEPLLLFKYRLEKAIIIYEMWGKILKLLLT